MRSRCLLLAVLLALHTVWSAARAQDRPPPNGPRTVDPGWHALVGARVVVAPGRVFDDTTIVLRDGLIVSVEKNAPAPAGARVHELRGRTVHAAWIDAHVPVDAPRPVDGSPGAHWHPAVLPQREASDGEGLPAALADELRALGFGAAALFPRDGIVRGRGAVVTLETPRDGARRRILRGTPIQALAFETQSGAYPSSRMGAVAMLRQTLLDAADARRPERSPGLALARLAEPTQFLFATHDELELLVAMRTMAELMPQARTLFLGSGVEFRRLDAIAKQRPWLVLPLAIAKAPAVSTPDAREQVALRQLLTWEQAPTNAARLRAAGVSIALTSDRLDERREFMRALREAIAHGLSQDDALAALTTEPAGMLGVLDRLGTIEAGKLANLCVVSGDPFGEDRVVETVWIAGVPHELRDPAETALVGTWRTDLALGDARITQLLVTRRRDARGVEVTLVAGDERVTAKAVHATPQTLDLAIELKPLRGEGRAALSATLIDGRLLGTLVAGDGTPGPWRAERDAEPTPAAPDAEEAQRQASALAAARERTARALPVPLGAFGRLHAPRPQRVAVRHATLWTSGPAGILEDATLHVDGGKVAWVGRSADAPAFDAELVIEAEGRHVTPGLIDCHSHTGVLGGINEGTQAVTAEVRIGDVLDPDDVDWYRQLAGGVTCVNQLHGSANPIGGQSQTTKLRWGVRDPEDMKLAGAMPGIKFALGENVKRSRSADNARYPNTRMGVEALIRDRFHAARAYAASWQAAQRELPATVPAHDLELRALAEVLAGQRLVHCHSYRQDEILMLCRVAKDFGFRIGTFQHGLEGYKVAEAIRDAATGASIFSDWWAYKYEVVDAIPENAAIMTRIGVNVSMNSDSDELARRLNTEAAKAVKYGGLSREQALHLVTINPAIQLGVQREIGSLQVGKSADFVIWTGDPLSTMSRCDETWIDGARYWSREEDRAALELVATERARLVQRVMNDADGGEAEPEPRDHVHLAGDCACEELSR
ncbi:MAG: amidohydrolase family protein [Planctomycetes bacterium]|nr:amidohydrolase family protein [Planctomycetota bacterium]